MMMKSSVYVVLIVISIAFSVFAYNGYKFPLFFYGKTEQVVALIYETGTTVVDPESSTFQVIKYAYRVGGKGYSSVERITTRAEFQEVGDTILIEYSVSKPSVNNVVDFSCKSLDKSALIFVNGYSGGYKQRLCSG